MSSWDLTGNANTNPTINFVGTTDQEPFAVRTHNKEALRVDANGNVGVGTPNPSSKLEIAAQDGLQVHGYQPFLTLKDSNSNDARARIQNANGDFVFYTESGFSSGVPALVIKNATDTVEIQAQDGLRVTGFQPFVTLSDSNSGFKRVRLQDANGDVVFYTESGFSSGVPALVIKNGTNTVEIRAQDGLQVVGFQPFLTLNDSSGGLKRVRIQDANGDVVFYTESGLSSGIPAMVIKEGSSDVTITGNLTVDKDVVLAGADCAEQFDAACLGKSEPGTVMVINEQGALEPCQQAYDKKVAGVRSGAGKFKSGILLDKQQSEKHRLPIALIGKAYCKVDADHSAIEVGDLLTTSPTHGHAMKADDPQKAFGAVIGKALEAWRSGCGLIPILIALQ